MHVNPQRQLREPLFKVVLALFLCFGPTSPAQTPENAASELQAAQLMEASLRARGVSREELRKLDEIYTALAIKFPTDVSVKNAHGAFLLESGQHERAEKILKEAEKLAPTNPSTQRALGAAALAGGDVRSAAHYMAKACAGQPENAACHFELANVLFLFRHNLLDSANTSAEALIDRALKHYAEACRLAPANVDFARGYAETFYGLPKPDWSTALAAWQHLLEISPQKDFALANLATVHLKLGQKNEARTCAEQIRSPEFATRKARILERIEKE